MSRYWVIVAGIFLLGSAIGLPGQASDSKKTLPLEQNAIGELRRLNESETTYAKRYPSIGYACTLDDFAPPRADQHEGPKTANLLNRDMEGGAYKGYRFRIFCPAAATPQNAYWVLAVPAVGGKNGNHSYCVDQTGVIKVSNDVSGADCPTGGHPMDNHK